MTYDLKVAGLTRALQICKVTNDLSIAAFIMLGDVELTVACAKELLKKCPDFDILLTAEAKSIPLIHEMARQSGKFIYCVARKSQKVYTINPLVVNVKSITTKNEQSLYLGCDDAARLNKKRILIVDDVISTGESLFALEKLAKEAGGEIVGKAAVLAEGDAAERKDIIFLEKLPLIFTV